MKNVILTVLLVLMLVGTCDARSLVNLPGTYDPKLLIPLEVGNTWTYRWTLPVTADTEKDYKVKVHGIKVYSYGGKRINATRYVYKVKEHEETYRIVRRDGNHYFFTVSVDDPNITPEQIRDARFEDSVENCWTWWNCRTGRYGSVGLTESVKREWKGHNIREYLLDNSRIEPNDYPADHRNALLIDYREDAWGYTDMGYTYSSNPCTFRYRTMGTDVKVPAGTFENCIEAMEIVRDTDDDKNPVLWETHTFWAPNIGKVREYQKRPDGSIAYDLVLLKFSPAGNKPHAEP